MIDTVVITLTKDMFEITRPEAFTPSASWALSQKYHRGVRSIQNPTKKELLSGIYKPRLTLSNRLNQFDTNEIMLKIELSLPKLMFGNNFAELRFKDFLPLMKKLISVLADMGISTTIETISQAPVAAIHYSKNICLTDGFTPNYYINKMREANIHLSLDVNQTEYRNEGHSYKWHANYYEVAFYDKIRDLEKAKMSNKRAIEHDNELQLELFQKLQKRNRTFEILRMEVRLNKRTKIKQLFKKLNIKADLTFKKLFKPAISKKILLHYLDELESKRPSLIDYKVTHDKALLTDLIFNNPTLSAKKIFQIYGFKKALETMNMRELRNMLARYHQKTWYRLMMDVNEAQLPHSPSPLRVLREQLVKFEAVKQSIIP